MDYFLFEGVNPAEMDQLKKRFRPAEEFRRGQELYRCGSIGILQKGTAKIIRRNEIGGTVTMRTIGKGEVFGAASVFGAWKEGSSSILSSTNCEVLYLTEPELREIFKEHPEVAANYIAFLSDRIRFLNRKIDTFSAGNTEERLYEYLASIADENGIATPGFGMAELARRLKIGRSSLYRGIETLENSGLIRKDNKRFIIK